MKKEIIKCNKCGSTDVYKAGLDWRGGKRTAQRYRCRNCGKIFVDGIIPTGEINAERTERESRES